ncbi:hypothetical protein Gohar_011240 [Gossypium harknessii]|uniref:Pectinesterase inhibitor domain-containing protein n=1 Tax=Gossypium harknessii TaxID=34285 RepID=A0A7J9GU26_9ROSI|nr:hypothetical protein [Gossypium harknessii]
MARLLPPQLFFLLTLVVIIHPSYGLKHLKGIALVDEVCRHTSHNEYCVDTIIPKPPLSGERIASTTLGWAQIKALEVGTIIASLLNDSSSILPVAKNPLQAKELLQICWDSNMNTMEDLWIASSLLYNKIINPMIARLYHAANTTRVCQDGLKGTSFTALAAKIEDIIKLCEICVVSTNFFVNGAH